MIELMLDGQGAHYSTNINSFESSVIAVFDKAIASTQNVPQLEKVTPHIVLLNAWEDNCGYYFI